MTSWILLIALPGCALQATSGPVWSRHQPASAAVTLGGTTHAYRASAGVVGARVGTAFDRGLVPRQAIVHGGYDWRAVPGWFVIEPGLDLGLGGPIAHAYSGLGAYVGGAASARLRFLGANDDETAFNVIATSCELVLMGRGGAWMPPERSGSTALVGEYAGELGLRFAIGSDAVVESQGRVREPDPPPPPPPPPPGKQSAGGAP